MRRRSFLAMSGAAGAAAAMPGIAAASAATTKAGRAAAKSRHLDPPSTLRGLAELIDLRIGTAVIPFDSNLRITWEVPGSKPSGGASASSNRSFLARFGTRT